MPSRWYYFDGSEKRGPVSSPELRSMAKVGAITPDQRVWKQGLPNPVPAHRIRGLFETSSTVDAAVETKAEREASSPGDSMRRHRLAIVVTVGVTAVAVVLVIAATVALSHSAGNGVAGNYRTSMPESGRPIPPVDPSENPIDVATTDGLAQTPESETVVVDPEPDRAHLPKAPPSSEVEAEPDPAPRSQASHSADLNDAISHATRFTSIIDAAGYIATGRLADVNDIQIAAERLLKYGRVSRFNPGVHGADAAQVLYETNEDIRREASKGVFYIDLANDQKQEYVESSLRLVNWSKGHGDIVVLTPFAFARTNLSGVQVMQTNDDALGVLLKDGKLREVPHLHGLPDTAVVYSLRSMLGSLVVKGVAIDARTAERFARERGRRWRARLYFTGVRYDGPETWIGAAGKRYFVYYQRDYAQQFGTTAMEGWGREAGRGGIPRMFVTNYVDDRPYIYVEALRLELIGPDREILTVADRSSRHGVPAWEPNAPNAITSAIANQRISESSTPRPEPRIDTRKAREAGPGAALVTFFEDAEALQLRQSHPMSSACSVLKTIRSGPAIAYVGISIGPATDEDGKADDEFRASQFTMAQQAVKESERANLVSNAKSITLHGVDYEYLHAREGSAKFVLLVGAREGRAVAFWFIGREALWPDFVQGIRETKFSAK